MIASSPMTQMLCTPIVAPPTASCCAVLNVGNGCGSLPQISACPYSSTYTVPIEAIMTAPSLTRAAARKMKRSYRPPKTKPSAVEPSSATHMLTCSTSTNERANKPPKTTKSPCAKLTARVARKIMWRPSATSA